MTPSNYSRKVCCPICGGSIGVCLLEILNPDRFEVYAGVEAAGYKRQWSECTNCGAAINIHPSGVVEKLAAISSGYYEIDLKASSVSQKYQQVMSLPSASSDNALRVKRVGEFVADWRLRVGVCQSRMRVLDIGAGTGVFLSKFISEEARINRIWEGCAFEPDDNAAAHLRTLKMFKVNHGLFTRSATIHNVDLCTLNKVVEHLLDPVDLMREAATSLNPTSGVLYVEVPAKETIECRTAADNILGALHHQLYDICSLDFAFRAAGMAVMRLERIYEPSGKISIAGFAVMPEAVSIMQNRCMK
jgi:2-polyprenyl-3-methyl-5-hydroxy-6-metoxy-1,4-benzoquinol methylase